jgi:hypothetical protein
LSKFFIGVDPGWSGGLVYACEMSLTGKTLYCTTPMPKAAGDIVDWFSRVRQLCDDDGSEAHAVIEKVTGYVGNGGNPGSAMFQFGINYGVCLAALGAARIPFDEVMAGAWQRVVHVSPRKKAEGKTVWKNRLKTRAQQLFPNLTVTLNVSDALLIMEYCRRIHSAKTIAE